MFKKIERCRVIPYDGLRELIYGRDNRILGFWELESGINIFTDSVEEYNNGVDKGVYSY